MSLLMRTSTQINLQIPNLNDTTDIPPPPAAPTNTNNNYPPNPPTEPASQTSPTPPPPPPAAAAVAEPAPSKWTSSGTDPTTLLNGLLDLYRTGVEREIRILILALVEFMQTCPEPLAVERVPPRPNRLRQNYFADEWARVDLKGGSQEDEGALKTELRRMYKGFSEHEHSKPLIERRAKQLLQAAGWLDIDFIHNERQPQYPSMTGKPKVETIEINRVFQAVQCSECRKCIRTQFFECVEGCKDPESTKNHYKCLFSRQTKSTSSSDNPNTSHLIPRMLPTPFRVCFSCVTTPTVSTHHDRSHLTLINASMYLDRKVPQNITFSRELDALEDFESGHVGVSTAAMLAVRVTGGKVRRMLPAGNVHMAYRFGTVVIENGASKHGVLITIREPPHLLFSNPPEYLLPAPTSTRKFCISPTSPRQILTKTDQYPPHRVLVVVKQVLSNPFSGDFPHHESCVPVIQMLSHAAEAYMNWNPLQPLTERIRAFDKAVKGILETLMGGGMGIDVVMQMQGLVETLLDKEFPLRWSPVGNNCQRFCNGLLRRCGTGMGGLYWRSDLDFAKLIDPNGKGVGAFRVYTHSFAGETRFPLFPPSRIGSEDESIRRLRKSDVGAYLSSLHNTTDFVSFTLGRKLWRRREDMFQGEIQVDPILGVECGLGCMHQVSGLHDVRELEEEAVNFADHVLGDPFTVMAVVGSQLSRGRGLCWDDNGRLWSGGASGCGAGGIDREKRERRWWMENRIKVGLAADVLLGFIQVVNIFGILLNAPVKEAPTPTHGEGAGEGGGGQDGCVARIREIGERALGPLPRPLRERKSDVAGRAVMPTIRQYDFSSSETDNRDSDTHHITFWKKIKGKKESGLSREALDWPGIDMWEMQPTMLPRGSVRTRLRCLMRWKGKGKGKGKGEGEGKGKGKGEGEGEGEGKGEGKDRKKVTWRRCYCEYCELTEEELRAAREGTGRS